MVAVLVPTRAGPRRPQPPAGARPVPVPAGTFRRRRAVAATLVAGCLLAVRSLVGALAGDVGAAPATAGPGAGGGPGGAGGGAGSVYVVQPGDTLWSIATRLDPTGDPRPLVDRLAAAQGRVTIYAGERIVLPQR